MEVKTVAKIIVGVLIVLLLVVCIVLGFVLSNCRKNCKSSSFASCPSNDLISKYMRVQGKNGDMGSA
jgi:hypothetical protein